MINKERFVIIAVLALVTIFVGVDLFTDFREGVVTWHVVLEGTLGIVAIFGIFYVLKGSFQLKHRLQKEIHEFSEFKKEADAWRTESRKYVDGLSKAIDQQLSKWNLSVAEKEVAFLLLKGLSLKEIAEIRQTTEKTARVQSMSIYAKSGLAGRSELSAFFLEDLLLPQELN
ncbi:MAG: helix-turn-helix transcriptional regulator [Oligoflexia bacterium]|nr:helix-turn-helix transcriptional regulator [Oligoflexia bacterium]